MDEPNDKTPRVLKPHAPTYALSEVLYHVYVLDTISRSDPPRPRNGPRRLGGQWTTHNQSTPGT